MADYPVTGAQSYVQYGIEDSAYGTAAGTRNSSFGYVDDISSTSKNSLIKQRAIGSRNAQKLIAGKYEGEVTITGTLGNGHWLAAFFGSSSSTPGTPDVHTFTESNTLPSITIEDGTDLGTTDSIRLYLGCVLNEVTLTVSEGEPVRFRAMFFYKTETEGTSLDGSPAADSIEPMNFSQGTVDLPNSSTLTRVPRIEIKMTNGNIRQYAIGSRFLSRVVPGARSYDFTLEKTFENASDLLEKFYGGGTAPVAIPAETATLVLNITNGEAGDDERHVAVTLTGVKLDNYPATRKPGEVQIERVTGTARSGGAVVDDNLPSTIFD